jgi:hypothetical protein
MDVTGTRAWRPAVFVAGLIWLALGGAVIAGMAVSHAVAVANLPYLAGAATVVWFGFVLASLRSTRVSLHLDGHELTMSWRQPLTLDPGAARLGRWVLPHFDSPVGIFIELHGRGRTVRIGARDHDGDGYALAAPPRRNVDAAVSAHDLGTLLDGLQIARDAPGPLVVELVRSSQTIGGLFRTLRPWIITIAITVTYGLTLAFTGLGERLTREPYGGAVMAGTTMAIAVIGLVATVRGATRVKRPALALRVCDDELVLERSSGDVLVRAPWQDVGVDPRIHHDWSPRGRWTIPVLVLRVGDHRALTLGVADQRCAWPGKVTRAWRSPRFLVGPVQWKGLVAALNRHRRLV